MKKCKDKRTEKKKQLMGGETDELTRGVMRFRREGARTEKKRDRKTVHNNRKLQIEEKKRELKLIYGDNNNIFPRKDSNVSVLFFLNFIHYFLFI